MALDIFSSFDKDVIDSTFKTFLVWGVPLVMCFFPLLKMWPNTGNASILFRLEKTILDQVKRVKGVQLLSIKGVLFSLFYILIILNFAGLWPFVFRVTRHLWFSISLGFTIWLGLLVSGWIYDFKSSAAHLYPSGAPIALGPLLVLIETLRILIRPISLSVRLVANIRTGHIVIALVGCFLRSLPGPSTMLITLIFSSFYFLFEIGICMIQAYIFFLLLGLYSDDHYFFGVMHEKFWFSRRGPPKNNSFVLAELLSFG